MRIWLSKSGAASLRDQLATQLMLAVISGDLKAGEKLPSVRELARRYHVHSNTVSAAYRDLTGRGWIKLRKGSGVYVRDLRGLGEIEDGSLLDAVIERFFADTRAHGIRLSAVKGRLREWLDGAPVRRVVVVEPEPELCAILVSELRGQLAMPVASRVLDGTFRRTLRGDQLAGAAVVALVSRAVALGAALPAAVPRHLLRVRSIPEHFEGQERPKDFALVGVASSSPEILRMARTILIAAGLSPDALEFRDAREKDWRRGLDACSFVIADQLTASRLPAKCHKRIFRVLSDSSLAELNAFLRLVTDQKVS